MKVTYSVKMTAQNDLGREYSVVQKTEYANGDIVRKCLYTSEYKGTKGKLDCVNVLHKIKQAF